MPEGLAGLKVYSSDIPVWDSTTTNHQKPLHRLLEIASRNVKLHKAKVSISNH